MTFVRLAGCNAATVGLACVRWCDTAQSWAPGAGRDAAIDEVAASVRLPRVCVTGGEPLLQAEALRLLVGRLQARGVVVHLETNGTLPLPAPPSFDWVTVSPKPPAYWVDPSFSGRLDEVKVVVDADFVEAANSGASGVTLATVEALAAAHPQVVVCLQPEAGRGEEGVRAAVELVMAHPAWRLSLQLHKVLGIP